MPQFLVAIHHPDNYVPSLEDQAMMRDISALNQEMIAAGVRKMPEPIVIPMTRATELHRPSVRGSFSDRNGAGEDMGRARLARRGLSPLDRPLAD